MSAEKDFLRPPFPTFVDLLADKVAEEGIDEDSVVPRVGLMFRKLHQLMDDDGNQRVHRPGGWSRSDFRICIALWTLGPIPSRRITEVTNMGRATVSAALNRLSSADMVTKEPFAGDLRSVMVRLTPKGETSIRESYAGHLQVEHEWFDVLTDIEKQVLMMLLSKVMLHRGPKKL
ncbi:MarR family winged helix-turn-helix transcriptional regulator [Nesterenkonia haasae]|uniref:MarR family winged helix-turn-helix transcriptional regulator n=1 Tax=Nesterenkonia haasae TaxID=2587813 RepID=UPI00139208E4|nr:winged helix DNA-binding protein [Nesterenkonia haasae]